MRAAFFTIGAYMEDTIFSKIVRGEIPCHKVYEDDATLAFLDIYPVHEGHVLVIPKAHATQFVWELDAATYQAVMETARKIALRLKATLPYAFIHGAVVGVDVPYAHVHLIPFDTTPEMHNPQRNDIDPNHAALAELAQKLYFTD